MNISKDAGLRIGEAVFNELLDLNIEASISLNDARILARSATLGGYSAYRFTFSHSFQEERWAWVKQNPVTDGIDVVFGTKETTQYDVKRGQIPEDNATSIELFSHEFELAATAVYDFLTTGMTKITSSHLGRRT